MIISKLDFFTIVQLARWLASAMLPGCLAASLPARPPENRGRAELAAEPFEGELRGGPVARQLEVRARHQVLSPLLWPKEF